MDKSRQASPTIEAQFINRRSLRAFSDKKLSEEQLSSLFEAMRWSPSCFNEQPWLVVCSTDGDGREKANELLADANRVWAQDAPALLFIATKLKFALNGEANRHAEFDAGSAWMSLALQAHAMGLSAHAMAGFAEDKSYAALGLDRSQFRVMAAVAVGYPGKVEQLPQNLQQAEVPTQRKPRDEWVRYI